MLNQTWFILTVFPCVSGLILASSTIANAQVTPDDTVNTQVDQNGSVSEITGGETRGGNLFHSFQEFSVQTGNEAFFDNAASISNIFSRVTGGNISNIDGLIRANGDASLFLINPAGIIFGENARLDIGGSFYGSTASSILFEDGEFSAVDNLEQPVLTINAPIGLSFRDQPGDIVNRSNFGLTTRVIDGTVNPVFEGNEFTIREATGLSVSPEQTIALLGGNVTLENAGAISAPGGQVELGGLSESGEITINPDGSLTFPEAVARGDVTLTDQARVKVAADGGGLINVNARNVTLDEQSELYAGIAEDAGSPEAQAGDITIDATESVRITGSGGIGEDTAEPSNAFALLFNDYDTALRNVVGFRPNQEDLGLPNLGRNPKPESTAVGNAGSININTDILEISDRGSLTAKVYGQGDTGDFNLQVNEITIDRADVLNQIISGTGNPGNININTNNLTVIGAAVNPERFFNSDGNSSFILADSRSFGSSGDINIDATNDINFDGVSNIGTIVLPGGEGNAGNINISAGGSFTAQGSLFQSTHIGEVGNPGNITLDVAGDIAINSVLLNSQLSNQGTGTETGGNITINANNFRVTGASAIEANTQGQGDAGDITINVANNLNFDSGSRVEATVKDSGVGNAGKIEINASSLSLDNESRLNTQTFGQGNAGDIIITTTDRVALDNSSEIRSNVDNPEVRNEEGAEVLNNDAEGDAGDIQITTGELTLINGSELNNTSFARGNAGNITVNASGRVFLDGGSQLSSDLNDLSAGAFDAVGNAGEISITAAEFTSLNNSTLQSSTSGQGNAGSVIINTTGNVTFDGNFGGIISQVRGSGVGTGGNVQITAGDSILVRNESLILANSSDEATGDAGNVTFNAENRVAIDESLVLSQIEDTAEGNAGNVNITANSIDLNNFGLISTNARETSRGNAGNIDLNAANVTVNTGANISALTENNFTGGNITIKGGNLALLSGGTIVTSTDSAGNAGNITVDLTGELRIDGTGTMPRPEEVFDLTERVLNELQESTGLFAASISGATGNGGSININSSSLELNEGNISAATESGSGGNITLTIDNTIRLENNSLISAQAANQGDGGNIKINTDFIIAFPSQNPGNGNDIIANAAQGDGGNIEINAESLLGIQQRTAIENNQTNDIDASSDFGLDGTVSIFTPESNTLEGITELPQDVVEPQETTAQACHSDRNLAATNQLVIQGRGSIPSDPTQSLDSTSILVDGQVDDSQAAIPAPIETAQGKIQPARGIKVTPSGEVILTAYHTDNAGNRLPTIPSSCGVAQ